MQSSSESSSSRRRDVFFRGSVQDAIDQCKRSRKLLLVFLHGLCDGESIRADAAVHHALHSHHNILALRLYDDLENQDPTAYEDAKLFKEIFPTIKSLPFLMILSPDGDPIAELEGYEVADEVQDRLVEASNELRQKEEGSSVQSQQDSFMEPSRSMESNQSSSFQTSFPAFPTFPSSNFTWDQASPPLSPMFSDSNFGANSGTKFSSPENNFKHMNGFAHPSSSSQQSTRTGTNSESKPLNTTSSTSSFGWGGGALTPFPFSTPQRAGEPNGLITNFPRSEAISMAEAIAKASSQAAGMAAGDAFGRSPNTSQNNLQTAQISTQPNTPRSYFSRGMDSQLPTPMASPKASVTQDTYTSTKWPETAEQDTSDHNVRVQEPQSQHSQSLGSFSSLDSRSTVPLPAASISKRDSDGSNALNEGGNSRDLNTRAQQEKFASSLPSEESNIPQDQLHSSAGLEPSAEIVGGSHEERMEKEAPMQHEEALREPTSISAEPTRANDEKNGPQENSLTNEDYSGFNYQPSTPRRSRSFDNGETKSQQAQMKDNNRALPPTNDHFEPTTKSQIPPRHNSEARNEASSNLGQPSETRPKIQTRYRPESRPTDIVNKYSRSRSESPRSPRQDQEGFSSRDHYTSPPNSPTRSSRRENYVNYVHQPSSGQGDIMRERDQDPTNTAQLLMEISSGKSPFPPQSPRYQDIYGHNDYDRLRSQEAANPPKSAFETAAQSQDFDDQDLEGLEDEQSWQSETDKAERQRSYEQQSLAQKNATQRKNFQEGNQQRNLNKDQARRYQAGEDGIEEAGKQKTYTSVKLELGSPKANAAKHIFSSSRPENSEQEGKPQHRHRQKSPRRAPSLRRKSIQRGYEAYGPKEHQSLHSPSSSGESSSFKGFDTASHRHTSPITSPRASRMFDNIPKTEIFKFSETDSRFSDAARQHQDDPSVENSPEKKLRLQQMDVIPLPDRDENHESQPISSQEQAVVGRAGMMTMGVGNMQVYLGALLVIVLGFLSGLFSLGAKQIAHATPSAVKEAIVQPFQLIGQQAKNTRDQSSQATSKSSIRGRVGRSRRNSSSRASS